MCHQGKAKANNTTTPKKTKRQLVFKELLNTNLTFPELSTPEKTLAANWTTPLGSRRDVPVVGLTLAGRESGTTGSTVSHTANTSGTP